MITFDEALATVLGSARARGVERVALASSLGRILARDVTSDSDLPRHDLSAMDGFACREQDLDAPLRIIETIPAGAMPGKNVGPGCCSRIMTGAPVPSGADTVVKVEQTEEHDGFVRVLSRSKNSNIRRRGRDLKEGDTVLKQGTRITPSEIAILAAVGCARPWVGKRPVVGVMATGDELVEPDTKPTGAKIRNSNSWQLCAQVDRAGCIPRYFGIAADSAGTVDRLLKKALAQCDVLLISGGVSVGDYDVVPDVLRANRIRLLFEKIAIKPGKPAVFGVKGRKYCFGLPGNPVATYVLFEMLVRPFLVRLMGGNEGRQVLCARLGEAVRRKRTDRTEFVPVKIGKDGLVYSVSYHGSAHIHAYADAQGLMAIPAGTAEVPAGTVTEVTILNSR